MIYNNKKRKFKKKKFGGDYDNTKYDNILQTSTIGADVLGATLQNTPKNYTLGKTISGASTGAKLGSMAGPIGTVAGAAIGGTLSAINASKQEEENRKLKEDRLQQIEEAKRGEKKLSDMAAIRNFPTRGVEGVSYYKYGGEVSDRSLVNEISRGGDLNKISNNNIEVTGNSHEEGGVKIPKDGIELEGGETIHETPSQSYVFSKELGFADKHKKIAKAISKAEARVQSKESDRFANNSLSLLKNKELNLIKEQEALKAKMSKNEPYNEYKKGGVIYQEGGIIEDPNIDSTYGFKPTIIENPYSQPNIITDPTTEPVKSGVQPQQTINTNTDFDTYTKSLDPTTIKSDIDLRTSLESQGISPDDYMDYLNKTSLDTGTRGFGEGQYSNVGALTYKSAINRNRDLNNTSDGFDLKFQSIENPDLGNIEQIDIKEPTIKEPIIRDSKSSNINLKDVDLYKPLNLLASSTSYLDNIRNAKAIKNMESEGIPTESLVDNIKLGRVNYAASKAEADRQRSALNKGISQSLSDSNVASRVKSANLATTIGAKNKISEREQLTNTQIANQEANINKRIDAANVKTTLRNKLRELGARDDIRRERSSNISNIVEDTSIITRDIKAQDLADRQNRLNLSLSDPRKQRYIASVNPEELKKAGFTNKQIQAMKEGKFSKEELDAWDAKKYKNN